MQVKDISRNTFLRPLGLRNSFLPTPKTTRASNATVSHILSHPTFSIYPALLWRSVLPKSLPRPAYLDVVGALTSSAAADHHETLWLFSFQPGNPHASLVTLATFMFAAISTGGFMYYGLLRSIWERIEPWVTSSSAVDAPEPVSLFGVDVTGSKFFNRPAVQRAVEFATNAHKGQYRKTREPYVAHCIATAAIVEGLLAPNEDDSRAEAAVITALLHDVLDDAGADLDDIELEFGPRVASMVSKVSQLSATNQLVRRRLRLNAAQPTPQEAAQLRHMILTMVSEPLVIVVKLADRLHNMRTVYALAPEKQRAVAEETRRVWCSLAERLGMFALKSELEDLCFAVLQPAEYRALRAELDTLWGLTSINPHVALPLENFDDTDENHDYNKHDDKRYGNDKASIEIEKGSGVQYQWLGTAHTISLDTNNPEVDTNTTSASASAHNNNDDVDMDDREAQYLTLEQLEVRDLVRTVLPFDASTFNMERLTIPPSARRGLEVLQKCAQALLQEITTESVAAGLEVTVQGRVKSLFSSFKKMARKGVPLSQVYDARALRVVVKDGGGTLEREAISACYKLLPAVHRLWKKVDGEDDDYIAQPKESGYQSLHTAVMGPGGVPMEVQIRTSTMHDVAEYGKAAHWAYKESSNMLPASLTRQTIATGHPMLRISPGGQLQDGVVVESEAEGMRLLVAVSLTSRKYKSVHTTKASPKEYEVLLEYATSKGYFLPGQGDMSVSLELYTLCSDGKYHRIDQFGHKLPTVAVPLTTDNNTRDQQQQPGRTKTTTDSNDDEVDQKIEEIDEATFLNNRIRLLRSMLEWGADIGSSDQQGQGFWDGEGSPSLPLPGHELAFESSPVDVMVLLWPSGRILRVPRGTTAGIVADKEGGKSSGSNLGYVTVNNRRVPHDHHLEDGDYIVLTQETVKV